MTLSKEELLSAHNNGTLEGLLLGHGTLPLKALESVLEEETSEKEGLLSQINTLEKEIESFEELVDDLNDEIYEMNYSL